MKRNSFKDGFTMIEAVLVLAIAGLIFLMVFVALPALQRQARDTQRREDITSVVTAIKKYQQNNRGTLPSNLASELANYLPSEFADPDGGSYVLTNKTCTSSSVGSACTGDDLTKIESNDFPNGYKMYVVSGATCDGTRVVKSNNQRKAAVLYRLEMGVYCSNT